MLSISLLHESKDSSHQRPAFQAKVIIILTEKVVAVLAGFHAQRLTFP
jgi:hypothetical protein